MNDLIEALRIFSKYANLQYPTNCSHDELSIMGIAPKNISEEDTRKLLELGFIIDEENECFKSYRFGSA